MSEEKTIFIVSLYDLTDGEYISAEAVLTDFNEAVRLGEMLVQAEDDLDISFVVNQCELIDTAEEYPHEY